MKPQIAVCGQLILEEAMDLSKTDNGMYETQSLETDLPIGIHR
jgi:hypothetical protein